MDLEMKRIIDLGNGFTIKVMDMYETCPRYTLLLGNVELAHGTEFRDRYNCRFSEYDDQRDVEWPITHYVAASKKDFIDQVMNKFRAERKAAREESNARSDAAAEKARLAKENAAILAIKKFKKENKEHRWL
jgi:hypothetical protein